MSEQDMIDLEAFLLTLNDSDQTAPAAGSAVRPPMPRALLEFLGR
jgi:hypothetical protein